MKQNVLSKTAVVILSCKDYESLEVSLPNYLENTPKDVHFFILQNGLGTYDKDRTVRVARRISDLYPERVTVVDWIPEAKPYRAIKQLLHDEKLSKFDYICKVDDDTFPVTTDWIEKLAASYVKNKEKYGDKMAFTFPLVNNNPWGFKRTVELMGLKNEYDEIQTSAHTQNNRIQSTCTFSLKHLNHLGELRVVEDKWTNVTGRSYETNLTCPFTGEVIEGRRLLFFENEDNSSITSAEELTIPVVERQESETLVIDLSGKISYETDMKGERYVW